MIKKNTNNQEIAYIESKDTIPKVWPEFKLKKVDVVQQPNQKPINKRQFNKIQLLNKIRDEYFKTTPKQLHTVLEHESIFTLRFIELLKKKLGCPTEFQQLTTKQQRKIADNVQQLLITETGWKALTTKSKHENRVILDLFPMESTAYVESFSELFFPHGERMSHKQVKEKFASSKCELFYEGFLGFLFYKKVPFLKGFDLKKVNINYADLVYNIDPIVLFEDLVKISMKQAFDLSINISQNNKRRYSDTLLNSPFLYVKRYSLVYSMHEVIIRLLALQVLEAFDNSQDVEVCSSPDEKIRFISDFFRVNNEEINNKQNRWFKGTYDIANILVDLFVNTDIVVNEVTERIGNSKHNTTILWLTHKMSNTIPFSDHVPRITPPPKITLETDYRKYVKKLLKGESTVSVSTKAMRALNIAQSKKMKVNNEYWIVMHNLHNNDEILKSLERDGVNMTTPFPTKHDINELRHDFQTFNDSLTVDVLQLHMIGKAKTYLIQKTVKKKNDSYNNKKQLMYDALTVAGVSRVEQDLNHKKKGIQADLIAATAKRQLLQTSLTLASIYDGFPIYYGTKLDYRTRMYPWEYLLSRTTGELKQLLIDYDWIELTIDGLVWLMKANYRFSLADTIKLNGFLRSSNITYDKLRQFFIDTNKERSEDTYHYGDQLCLWCSLNKTLSQVYNNENNKTGIMLEIDQKASGMTILALLLKLPKLARITNLTSNEPQDVYIFVMSMIKKYWKTATYVTKDDKGIKQSIPFSSGRVLDFLSTDRSVNKGMLMRWSYGEGGYSRGIDLVGCFKDYYVTDCTDHEFEQLHAFANNYDDFLDSIFPRLSEKKDLLLEVVRVRTKATQQSGTNAVNILTLDGCAISWDFTPTVSTVHGYYNPVVGKPINYRVNKEAFVPSAFKKREDDIIRSFYPNFVHSIDGAMMRYIITEVYNRSGGYIIGHVHDCILIHPNFVSLLYEVINDLYTGPLLDDLADRLFFEPMKEGLADNVRNDIADIKERFDYASRNDHINTSLFKPENAYCLEGSVSELDIWLTDNSEPNSIKRYEPGP